MLGNADEDLRLRRPMVGVSIPLLSLLLFNEADELFETDTLSLCINR